MLIWILAALFPIQPPTNAFGGWVEDAPSALLPIWKTQMRFQAVWPMHDLFFSPCTPPPPPPSLSLTLYLSHKNQSYGVGEAASLFSTYSHSDLSHEVSCFLRSCWLPLSGFGRCLGVFSCGYRLDDFNTLHHPMCLTHTSQVLRFLSTPPAHGYLQLISRCLARLLWPSSSLLGQNPRVLVVSCTWSPSRAL